MSRPPYSVISGQKVRERIMTQRGQTDTHTHTRMHARTHTTHTHVHTNHTHTHRNTHTHNHTNKQNKNNQTNKHTHTQSHKQTKQKQSNKQWWCNLNHLYTRATLKRTQKQKDGGRNERTTTPPRQLPSVAVPGPQGMEGKAVTPERHRGLGNARKGSAREAIDRKALIFLSIMATKPTCGRRYNW